MKQKKSSDILLIDPPPQLPEGHYVVSYLRHDTTYVFNTPKVFVHFVIQEPNEHRGKKVYRAYRVSGFSRKGKGGGIKLRASSDLFRQFVRLSGVRERPDRINLRRLKGCLIVVSIRTVTQDYRQKPLVEALWYSVVDELISIHAGAAN